MDGELRVRKVEIFCRKPGRCDFPTIAKRGILPSPECLAIKCAHALAISPVTPVQMLGSIHTRLGLKVWSEN